LKTYKILKILGVEIGDLIRIFYRNNQTLKTLAYDEHFHFLKNLVPVHFNHFAEEMRNLGHECNEVIYDLELLQKSWANENGVQFGWHSWKLDILMEQIRFYRPEIIYLQNLEPMPFWLLQRIKEIFPFVRKILAFKGNLPNRVHELKGVDYVFAGHPAILEDCQESEVSCELFYHCFDERVLSLLAEWELSNQPDSHPFAFIGYSGFGGYGNCHNERYELLKRLFVDTDISIWTSEGSNLPNSDLPANSKPLFVEYPERCRKGVFGLPLFSIIKNSEIVFNKHAEICKGNIGNMRLFETTGVGSCLLTDTGSNMSDLFVADEEVVTYASYEELIEKLRHLSENESARKALALAGQKRTLKDHSLKLRCEQISEALRKIL